jgi:GTP-binding protein HflX
VADFFISPLFFVKPYQTSPSEMDNTKSKNETITPTDERERAVMVAVIRDGQDPRQANEFLDELEFLAETASIHAERRFTQRLSQPSSRIYVGPGKLEEIADYCAENEISVVIFDDELSPSQTRNIEQAMPCRVIDRTRLILDIFRQRAQTAYAKTQVELAQCEYMLPRLAGLWTHLERQRGGTGTRGGAGEREIETDRRIVRNRISKLKEDLKKIDRQMAVQRSNRGHMVRVSLVGYTNVGKSTLMNLISKSEVFAENKLFATLDTTVRKVVFDNLPFLLSDTVGFIRKLPTELIESFKSTLDEVREADLLIHVVDISHPQFEEQIDVVKQTLQDIGAGDKPVYLVFNKIDAYTYIKKEEDDLTPATKENRSLDDLRESWFAKQNTPCIFISAAERTNIDKFRRDLYGMVREIHCGRYPFNNFLY